MKHRMIPLLLGLSLCVMQPARSATPADGQTVSLHGIDLYYEVHGQGEPLVLLHGFTGSGATWQPIVHRLAQHYQVVLPDLRGHGRSTNPAKEFTFRQSARDVFALLDHLGIDEIKAMGMSGGGMTLLHMATQQPRRIEAMVLIAATTYFPEQARVIMGQMTVESRSDEEWRLMRQLHRHGDDQIRALWNQARAFKDSYDDMNFTAPYLKTIRARTLIVHGDRDPLFPARIAMEMYAAIPRSYLWIVPNGGHLTVLGEGLTEPFLATTSAFLSREWEP